MLLRHSLSKGVSMRLERLFFGMDFKVFHRSLMMIILNNSNDKVEIEYPCSWSYKVIGLDAEALQNAVAMVLGKQKYLLTHSRSSSGGKYQSMHLETVVESEDRRNAIFNALQSHAAVRMVL